MDFWTQSESNIFIAAHRGWSERFPENTMPAFEAALGLGVDQIEVDVRVTKDGELVIIHDGTVDRTTDGTGKVCEMTFDELRSLDAGAWKGAEFAGCRIPTFIEFLELVKGHPTMTIDVELKEYPTEGWEATAYGVCDRALRLVDEYGYADRCVVNTFSGRLHEYIRDKYGDKYRQHVYFPVSHLGECAVDPYEYGYCVCMFGPVMGMAEKADFESIRKYGIRTWAGASVKDAATVDYAIECGAELITCNNPDAVLELLRGRGRHR